MSRLEMRAPNLVPRSTTRIVICDNDGNDLALRGATRLQQFGYSDVKVLEGGTKAWQEAGFETFSGMNVPSKLFGEFIEHHYDTPSLSAEELKARIDAGEDLVIVGQPPARRVRDDEYPRQHLYPRRGTCLSNSRSSTGQQYIGRGELCRAYAQHYRRAIPDQRRYR